MSKGAFKQTSFMRIALTVIFAAEIAALVCFFPRIWQNGSENRQDAVAVNEAAQSVKKDWDNIAAHVNQTELDYVVLNEKENVIYVMRSCPDIGIVRSANVSHSSTGPAWRCNYPNYWPCFSGNQGGRLPVDVG